MKKLIVLLGLLTLDVNAGGLGAEDADQEDTETTLHACYVKKIKNKCGLVKPTGIYIGIDFILEPKLEKHDAFSQFDLTHPNIQDYMAKAAKSGNKIIYRAIFRALLKGTANEESRDLLKNLVSKIVMETHPKQAITALAEEMSTDDFGKIADAFEETHNLGKIKAIQFYGKEKLMQNKILESYEKFVKTSN